MWFWNRGYNGNYGFLDIAFIQCSFGVVQFLRALKYVRVRLCMYLEAVNFLCNGGYVG
jgi:hypothetical protein